MIWIFWGFGISGLSDAASIRAISRAQHDRICRHVFTQRIPGIDVSNDKPEVLKRLDSAHRKIRNAVGVGDWPLATAQQVHGNKIAVVDTSLKTDKEFPGRDGIITNQSGIVLGVYVADCCAVYIVDPKTPAIGLVHSGRKGTELGVVMNAIAQMIGKFGSKPADLIVQLSPCIHPPHVAEMRTLLNLGNSVNDIIDISKTWNIE